jgi:hypothetical protein
MSKNNQNIVLDVGEDYKDKKRIVNEEINYQNIQDYENNYNYKVSYINIDSRFRTSVPQNVVDNMINYLPLNPITTFKDEYRVKVNIGTHSFKIGDKIILQNITAKNVILSNPIYLISDYSYFMVYMNNHNILPLYTKSDDYKINISLFEEALITDRIIGNIPLNSLLGNHSINVYNNDELFLPDPVRNRILTELNISTTELIENYFFIKLPFNYININIINNDTVFDLFQNIKKIFRFEFNNIGCINLYYLNANYPINNTQYQALHEITNIGETYVEFNSSSIAFFDETNGGDGVVIGLVLNTIEGYPNANNYTISLKKTLTDVISIGLVSSEFPYVKYNLQNNITIKNNKLYWKFLEDGDYVYSTTILEGNYFIDSLVSKLTEQMNSIERISSTAKEIVYNNFDIKYDTDSQEFKFISYKINILSYSLSLSQDLSIGSEILKLKIKHPNNYVSVGDTIVISNATDIGDISATLINKSHIVYSLNTEESSYTVLLSTTKFIENINLDGDGGAKTTIKTPVLVSFLFNYNDTMGKLLGFKYVGESTSITPFSHINSNMSSYIYITPFDAVGSSNITNNYFDFIGQNYYLLMYLNDYDNIYMTNNFNNAFAKILMDGHPSDTLFNTYVCSPLIFDIPIKSLNELKIKFLYPDGTNPDFRNLNHSMTLKVIERVSTPKRTGLNSMKMSYIDSLKEFAFNLIT